MNYRSRLRRVVRKFHTISSLFAEANLGEVYHEKKDYDIEHSFLDAFS